MGVDGEGNDPLQVTTNEADGQVTAHGGPAGLRVARGESQASSSGAGSLKLDEDGAVKVQDLASRIKVTVDFDHGGQSLTATLIDGAAPSSGSAEFTPAQVKAAQQAAIDEAAKPKGAVKGTESTGPTTVVKKPVVKPAAKKRPLTKAQKLAKALKQCHKLKSKKRRAACSKAAKKKYAANKKKSKTKSKKRH